MMPRRSNEDTIAKRSRMPCLEGNGCVNYSTHRKSKGVPSTFSNYRGSRREQRLGHKLVGKKQRRHLRTFTGAKAKKAAQDAKEAVEASKKADDEARANAQKRVRDLALGFHNVYSAAKQYIYDAATIMDKYQYKALADWTGVNKHANVPLLTEKVAKMPVTIDEYLLEVDKINHSLYAISDTLPKEPGSHMSDDSARYREIDRRFVQPLSKMVSCVKNMGPGWKDIVKDIEKNIKDMRSDLSELQEFEQSRGVIKALSFNWFPKDFKEYQLMSEVTGQMTGHRARDTQEENADWTDWIEGIFAKAATVPQSRRDARSIRVRLYYGDLFQYFLNLLSKCNVYIY